MPPSKSSSSSSKRPAAENDPSISPPPLKRKAQSVISKAAVANFFTPTSQKPKERTTWTERSPHGDTPATLLVAKYVPDGAEEEPLPKRRKIAAFDLDSTLITTASGKKHSDDATDWKWWDRCVPMRLKQLFEEGYRVVIFTNQGGLTLHPDPKSKAPKNLGKNRVASFRQKCSSVLAQLDLPLTLYAATAKDIYRKPRTGMWKEMCDDYDLREEDIDLENSIFVGDAGGRMAQLKGAAAVPKDFSCSDRNLAHNVGIEFQTPEEFFLGEQPREFARDFDLVNFPFAGEGEGEGEDVVKFEKKNDTEIVLFCGPPGAGKSTFYWEHLKPLGYERVNQDTLKSKVKCFQVATDFLRDGESVAIDNTNPDPDIRAQWVELAQKNKVPIRCVWFRTPIQLCEHNDAVRSMNKSLNPESRPSLPKLAFNGFSSRFKEPKLKEGFQEIVEVDFKFRGTKEEYEVWGRYWL
ncbi:polynucleotide kinase 3 phosphatase [Phialemonium atrogriseum]|uniref:Polynucleotide kinase 3 phosphatase n=1 Tax=Phialemonium atrogriseum TaxID=1093897 RepID=A0AAJ0BW58_9PEZI|nr:polynucleotide kinase 3 phosphatase [Phialemonium atrogriseum]KAK1765385.1 polynucleotide kinase 3 phosphatase [Phialemonium atrogriseum]